MVVSIHYFDYMYSYFTCSHFKWLMVEVLGALGLNFCTKMELWFPMFGKSGKLIFWTSVTGLVSGLLSVDHATFSIVFGQGIVPFCYLIFLHLLSL